MKVIMTRTVMFEDQVYEAGRTHNLSKRVVSSIVDGFDILEEEEEADTKELKNQKNKMMTADVAKTKESETEPKA